MTRLEHLLLGLGMAEIRKRLVDDAPCVYLYELDMSDLETLLRAVGKNDLLGEVAPNLVGGPKG